MSERSSFYRKLGYLAAIMVLLFPLAWLSIPATKTEAGGKLAQLRKEHRLSQANLGEIDPLTETMKLVTLGLRGVAVNQLWTMANHYKKVEDWDNLSATLNQLAHLQPNVIHFWKFQAWNLSYNVSVEFDDYHDRYAKVIEGIKFLERGVLYNEKNAQLLWDLGWFLGQKIGRADEHVQYRRLFKADKDFHPADRPQEQRDNWLVGKSWYQMGIDAVKEKPLRLGKKSPRIFMEGPAKSQINYAEAIEEEGYFDKARRAWEKARDDWHAFGQEPIEHSTGVILRLGNKAKVEKDVADKRAELDAMLPDARAKLKEEKLAALTADERKILEARPETLSPEQGSKLTEIQAKVEVTDRHVAERIAQEKPDQANTALRTASELQRLDQLLNFTDSYRRDSNYEFWENSCNFEPTTNAIEARKAMFNAKKARLAADVTTAKKLYKEGFEKWRLVIDEFPLIMNDEATTGDDIVDYIKEYKETLEQLDETIPEDFPLWDVIEKFDREQELAEELAEHKKRQAGTADKPADAPPASADATKSQQP